MYPRPHGRHPRQEYQEVSAVQSLQSEPGQDGGYPEVRVLMLTGLPIIPESYISAATR